MTDDFVRTARRDDLTAVGDVQSRVWREAYADVLDAEVIDTFAPETFAEVWQRSLAAPPSPRHRLLVATASDVVVGFVAVGPGETEATGEILALGVDPAHRRTGHGSRLLNAAIDVLHAGDSDFTEAWVISTDDLTRAFLTAAGFGPDGAWRDRVVGADGATAREIRLVTAIGQ